MRYDFLLNAPVSNVPAAPTGLTATAVSSSQINLAWSDNSRNEDGFQIERSNDNRSWKLIVTVGPNVRNFSNTDLTGNKTYSYRVHLHGL